MLILCLIVGVICFIVSQLALDLLFGVKFGNDYLKLYYDKIRGEEKKEKQVILKKKENKTSFKKHLTYWVYSLPAIAVIFFCSYIFFKSVFTAAILCLLGFFYPKYKIKAKIRKRKEILNIQLREAMISISNSLKAGNSLQIALERCLEDMRRMLRNKVEKPIIEEFENIVYDIQIGKTLEEALIGFRERTRMEDVDTFVNAAIITKEKGGNLAEVMANVSDSISDKIQIKREIMTLTAGKRSEAKLLTFVPIILVMALSTISPSYMRPMYETLPGKIMMIIGVVLLAINYFLGKKIINIEI
ncbi:MAG: type II secretion system F family protein [Aminipila sp.]